MPKGKGKVDTVLVERFGNTLLPLGGKSGYQGVRGKQGKKRNKFQGYTPKKTHFTRLHPSAQEAAVARANLLQDLSMGIDAAPERKQRAKRGSLVGIHVCSRTAAALCTDICCACCAPCVCAWQKK